MTTAFSRYIPDHFAMDTGSCPGYDLIALLLET